MAPRSKASTRGGRKTASNAPKPIDPTEQELRLIPQELLPAAGLNTIPPMPKFPDMSADFEKSIKRDSGKALETIIVDTIKEGAVLEASMTTRSKATSGIGIEVTTAQTTQAIPTIREIDEPQPEDEEEEVDYDESEGDQESPIEQVVAIETAPIRSIASEPMKPGEILAKRPISVMSTPPVGKRPLQRSSENEQLALTTRKLGEVMNLEYITTRTLNYPDEKAHRISDAFNIYMALKSDTGIAAHPMTLEEEYILIEYIAENEDFEAEHTKPLLYGLRKSQGSHSDQSVKPMGKIVESLVSLEKSLKKQVEQFTKQNEFLRSTGSTIYSALGKVAPSALPSANLTVPAKREIISAKRDTGIVISEPKKMKPNVPEYMDLENLVKPSVVDKGKGVMGAEKEVTVSAALPPLKTKNKDGLKKLLDDGILSKTIDVYVLEVLSYLEMTMKSFGDLKVDTNILYHKCYDVIVTKRAELFDPYFQPNGSLVRVRREFVRAVVSSAASSSK